MTCKVDETGRDDRVASGKRHQCQSHPFDEENQLDWEVVLRERQNPWTSSDMRIKSYQSTHRHSRHSLSSILSFIQPRVSVLLGLHRFGFFGRLRLDPSRLFGSSFLFAAHFKARKDSGALEFIRSSQSVSSQVNSALPRRSKSNLSLES